MLLANPIGYYSVNVKKTTWTLIGLILDVTLTMGAASAALAALGIIGQSIGKVTEENGELCVYRFLLTSRGPQTTRRVEMQMPHSCFRAVSKCRYRQHGKCSVNDSAVSIAFNISSVSEPSHKHRIGSGKRNYDNPAVEQVVDMRPNSPSVFISHNHQDKTFVRRLGADQQRMASDLGSTRLK